MTASEELKVYLELSKKHKQELEAEWRKATGKGKSAFKKLANKSYKTNGVNFMKKVVASIEQQGIDLPKMPAQRIKEEKSRLPQSKSDC